MLRLVLGAQYAGGALTLSLMFFYPIHQSMGQIGSAMLYATERVAIQVTLGIVFMIVSMAVTYLMLAPHDAAVPGLGLASTGLAVKMVVMQLIQVNIVAYIIARTWRWPFDWIYQPMSVIGCIALGWLAHGAATYMAAGIWPVLLCMGLGGVIYLVLITLFVYCVPALTGLTRETLVADAAMLLRHAVAGLKLR